MIIFMPQTNTSKTLITSDQIISEKTFARLLAILKIIAVVAIHAVNAFIKQFGILDMRAIPAKFIFKRTVAIHAFFMIIAVKTKIGIFRMINKIAVIRVYVLITVKTDLRSFFSQALKFFEKIAHMGTVLYLQNSIFLPFSLYDKIKMFYNQRTVPYNLDNITNSTMSKTTKIVLGVIIVVLLLLIGFIWSTYNGLITTSLAADTQWANVETSYQRRWDLLPRLEAALKSAYRQEDAIFGMIAKARTMYAGAKTIDEKVGAINQLDSAMARLLVIVEQYPQLKSIDIVGQYYAETAGTENRISVERMRYNESILAYNLKVQTFPSNVVARMFGFNARDWFKAVVGAETPPPITL